MDKRDFDIFEKVVYEGLVNNRSADEIENDIQEAIMRATERYEKEREALEKERAEREYKEKKVNDARIELGCAIVNYLEATGTVITESMYEDIDAIIELLPRLRVYKPGKIWEEFWK